MIETVLCYIEYKNQYLMMFRNKKANDINKNKYIGIGGHIEPHENSDQALIREVKEETNINLNQFKLMGKIYFHEVGTDEVMYLYRASIEEEVALPNCDEGTLVWVDINKLGSLPMWEGDKYFLDKIKDYNSPFFEMKVIYDNGRLVSIEEL